VGEPWVPHEVTVSSVIALEAYGARRRARERDYPAPVQTGAVHEGAPQGRSDGGRAIRFRLSDPDRALAAVRLVSDGTKRHPPEFRRRGSRWELWLPQPPLDRLEYLFEIEAHGGSRALVLDPETPLRAPGPFGDKSVVELDGYRAPGWLHDEAPYGDVEELRLLSRALRAELDGLLWHPPGRDRGEPLPLLVAHDGPEYAQYSALTRYLDVATDRGDLPPLRAALLAPVDRNETYAASARYTAALSRDLLPALRERVPATGLVGMGASLGALALLHAQRARPETFAGLFLQSGSFFQRRLDRAERGFPRFERIVRFVGRVLACEAWEHPIPVTLTCGTGEENLGNNRALAESLDRQGYAVELVEHRDAHNWVAWRDVLDPHLARLVERAIR
jgi:enterochelin esterase-like enzyme